MRALRILLLGIVGLVLTFLVQVYIVGLVVGIVLLPFLFLIVGLLILPRSRRAVRVCLEPIVIEPDDVCASMDAEAREQLDKVLNAPARLNGKTIKRSYFKQWLEFRVEPYHFLLLFAVGAISLGMAVLVLAVKDTLFGGVDRIYLGLTFWCMALYLSQRWLWERRILRAHGVALGYFSVAGHRNLGMKQVRYNFFDHEHERRGGIFSSLFVDTDDDLTLIFFNEINPDQSVPASAMIFHRIAWNETGSESG